MGNTGSSSGAGGGASAPAATAKKTCYYELLAVERSATQEEIKKAYKRKALELHPDRNYNDVERATILFAEVQAAYEVLSDPHERAWYDSHRETILHGRDPHGSSSREGGGGERASYTATTTSEEILSWFALFPSKSKIDYTDSPTGFYTVLYNAFSKLASEERDAAKEQGLEEPWFPSFGGSKSGYDDHVREFYQHWTSYKTIKDFSWEDVYRLSDAPDRRIRRAMEKENERLRHTAKREYEDNIREFVQFVRKRDPRYTPHTPKTDAERREEQLARSKEQAARARAANAAAQKEYKPADWTQVASGDERVYEDEYSEVEEGEEEEEQETLVWECVACKKTFKTEGQFSAHEKSKKHKQAVWKLKKKMEKENKELGLSAQASEEEDEDGGEVEVGVEEEEEEEEAPARTPNGHIKSTNQAEVLDEAPSSPKTSTQNGTKLPKTKQKTASKEEDDDDANEANEPDEDEDQEGEEEEEEEDSDHAPTSKFHARIFGSSSMPGETSDDEEALADTFADTSLTDDKKKAKNQPQAQAKIGKAKAKREKKKAAAAAGGSGAGTPIGNENTCVSCNEQFSSKTKMFAHLKENPSHTAPPTQVKGAKATSGSAGGGKKGKGKKK